jgi:hypothetical protein
MNRIHVSRTLFFVVLVAIEMNAQTPAIAASGLEFCEQRACGADDRSFYTHGNTAADCP